MDKSQLRKLTQEFTNGGLDEDEFRRARVKLIDDITAGRVAIVREPTPRPMPRPRPAPPSPNEPPASIKPVYVAVGLLVLAAFIFGVYPHKPDRPFESVPTTAVQAPAEVEAPGPGERLVAEFLQTRSWSAEDLSQFATAWNALTDIEREETRVSGDLERLFEAILRELNAQQALAALDDTGAARQASARIHALGMALGMEHRLPSIEIDAATPPAIDETTSGEVAATTSNQEVEVIAIVETETLALPLPVIKSQANLDSEAPSSVDTTPDNRLDQNPSGSYTIQLFALSNLENVQSVLAGHDDLDLGVVSLPDSVPPHRIIFGAYATTAAAEAAYAKLPASLTQGRTKPVIKTLETLQVAKAGVGSKTTDQLDKSRRWLGAQSRDQFTLQLFAMNADESVERLLANHPDLSLEVHYSQHQVSRFRILYGAYETPEDALLAFQSLPKSLTTGSGNPVVKSFSELQDTSLAASP